jgi:hypothetical protein
LIQSASNSIGRADGINRPVRDSLGLLKWRHPANQFGYRVMIRREPL